MIEVKFAESGIGVTIKGSIPTVLTELSDLIDTLHTDIRIDEELILFAVNLGLGHKEKCDNELKRLDNEFSNFIDTLRRSI